MATRIRHMTFPCWWRAAVNGMDGMSAIPKVLHSRICISPSWTNLASVWIRSATALENSRISDDNAVAEGCVLLDGLHGARRYPGRLQRRAPAGPGQKRGHGLRQSPVSP